MRFWFCLLLLLCGSAPGRAQDSPGVRRVMDALRTTPPGLVRVKLLDSLCNEVQNYDPIRAVRYGEEGLKLAQQAAPPPVQCNLLLSLGGAYAALSDDVAALRLYQRALHIARRLDDADLLVHCYNHLASQAYYRNDTLLAWHDFNRALALLSRPAVQPHTKIILLSNISTLCFDQERDAAGLRYTKQALALAEQHHDSLGQCQSLINLAHHYSRNNQPTQAATALKQAVDLAQRLRKPRYEATATIELGYLALEAKRFGEAQALARRALRLARQTNDYERLLGVYGLFADAAYDNGRIAEAYEWQLRHHSLNDSLNNRSRLQLLASMRLRFATQEKERRIQQLDYQARAQQLRNWGLLGVVAALLLGLGAVSVLYWQLRRSRASLALQHATLQHTAAQLRQTTAAKDRLYSIVAHDLRGPLASFTTLTELIELYLRQDDLEALRALPALVRASSKNLNELLDNLLSWTTSQTGGLAYLPEQLSVAELFAEAENLYLPTTANQQIRLTVECADGLVVYADRNMMRTILRNLLGNAFKFTPAGGHIQLLCAAAPASENTAVLSVIDNGYGMQPERVQALLGIDNQTENDTWRLSTGTGLGLLLCREFVARQGGQLLIDSEPGRGTTVRVQLPMAAVRAQPSTPLR